MNRCVCVLALVATLVLGAGTIFAQAPDTATSSIEYLGTTSLSGTDTDQIFDQLPFLAGPEVNRRFEKPGTSGTISPARVPAAGVPRPVGKAIVSGTFFGFPGLTHLQQATAPTGVPDGLQFQLEPPDQGLAVGGGFVGEAVNLAVAIYDPTSGTRLKRQALNSFFNLPPAVRSVPPSTFVFGPRLSDPRVYFDGATGRFFLTVNELDVNPVTGNFSGPSALFIAVSQTNNPQLLWNIFKLNITSHGDARFGACPCFGDEPLIGADANGFYLSTNVFSVFTLRFRGEQLHAIGKSALVTGLPPFNVVRLHNLDQAEGPAFSLQPAAVPPGGTFESAAHGTEYFVSSLDFTSTLDDRLTVWALTNTSSLNSTPNLKLTSQVISTEVYGQPPAAEQQDGPTPLRDALASGSTRFKNHLELIETNDDRLQQVVFAAGKLWTSLNSVVKTRGPVRTGAAWFILTPSVDANGQVSASVANQGYVAIDTPHQSNVIFPSIGVNAAGEGVMSFTVVGVDEFPSAAYAKVDAVNGAGDIVISGPGVLPDDGFTGYAPFAFRVGRWGDYSAAVADADGNIWLGTEFIPNAPRSPLANWGTFITKVVP